MHAGWQERHRRRGGGLHQGAGGQEGVAQRQERGAPTEGGDRDPLEGRRWNEAE
jgi:hypothetical protein